MADKARSTVRRLEAASLERDVATSIRDTLLIARASGIDRDRVRELFEEAAEELWPTTRLDMTASV